MIHILTVHWKDPFWINIQLEYFKRYISTEYRVYSFLNGINNPLDYNIDFISTENITSHPKKLNILSDVASYSSKSDNDIIIFIDGDAFPVNYLTSYINKVLRRFPLIAVQRIENGDIQPHPCFCATTLGFWKKINGDWKEGFYWKNLNDQYITDVGGKLLKKLNDLNIKWYPMHRSNKSNIHPLLFGVYDNLIYHHGAGFRGCLTRIDINNNINGIRNLILLSFKYFPQNKLFWDLKNKLCISNKKKKEISRANEIISDEIKELILKNKFFYQDL